MNRKTKTCLAFLGGTALGVTGISALLSHDSVARKPLVLSKIFSMLDSGNSGEEDYSSEYSHEKYIEYDSWCASHGAKEYSITAKDGAKLVGYLIPSEEASDIFVLCAHGYHGTRYGDFGAQAKFYHSLGYNVILVDQRASGKSEGKYIGFGYYESQDLIEWLKFFNNEFGNNIKFIVAGISMGGASVCMMSGDENLPENVVCIISDCAYTTANDEIKYCIPHYIHCPAEPFLTVVNIMNSKIAGYTFKMADAISSVKKAKVPMLFIHGGADDFVPTKMVYELYDACPTEKDLFIAEKAIHAQSFFAEPEKYQEKVKEFIGKYL